MPDRVTKEQIQEQLESVIEEQKALLQKFPTWVKWTAGAMIVALAAAAIAACAAGSLGTGPGAPVAMMICVSAIVALLSLLINTILNHMAESSELDEIRAKERELKRMEAALKAQD